MCSQGLYELALGIIAAIAEKAGHRLVQPLKMAQKDVEL